jgi:cytochrome P450
MPNLLAVAHPFDPAILEEPWDYYCALRSEAPVFRDPHAGIVHVASYSLVMEALKRHDVFSNRFAPAMGGPPGGEPLEGELADLAKRAYPMVDTMLTADPPEHKRFRGLVNKAFTPRRVGRLADGIAGLAGELVDRFESDGQFEVLSQFSVLLPLTVIADQLGVPRSDLPRFKRWTDGFTAQLGGFAPPEDLLDVTRRIVEYQEYFAARLDECALNPRDDILSDLVRARLEGEKPLDVTESLSIIQQLLVAGNETTASAIAAGVRLLIENPGELERVRAEPALIPNLVEEVLRISTPTQNMWRKALATTELGGVEIPEGAMMMLRFGSANRDESQFPDPDRFDVGRANADEHVAFGHGVHFCLGAMLARKEMALAFETLLSRLENLGLADGHPPPRHKPSLLLRGLDELHVRFDRRV